MNQNGLKLINIDVRVYACNSMGQQKNINMCKTEVIDILDSNVTSSSIYACYECYLEPSELWSYVERINYILSSAHAS